MSPSPKAVLLQRIEDGQEMASSMRLLGSTVDQIVSDLETSRLALESDTVVAVETPNSLSHVACGLAALATRICTLDQGDTTLPVRQQHGPGFGLWPSIRKRGNATRPSPVMRLNSPQPRQAGQLIRTKDWTVSLLLVVMGAVQHYRPRDFPNV
ncbi:hypothetical protein CSOJ01_04864 [Colletotrichum sojae]|uniref:Uncharacterized protein n=1 Tax=Colletotrichum sojae TaxID=2175907 RepID=A0A8H6JGR6_9PEZI|nr:hypothetical protein CSOJ01_04864 [Colletotrichum sojae]